MLQWNPQLSRNVNARKRVLRMGITKNPTNRNESTRPLEPVQFISAMFVTVARHFTPPIAKRLCPCRPQIGNLNLRISGRVQSILKVADPTEGLQ